MAFCKQQWAYMFSYTFVNNLAIGASDRSSSIVHTKLSKPHHRQRKHESYWYLYRNVLTSLVHVGQVLSMVIRVISYDACKLQSTISSLQH